MTRSALAMPEWIAHHKLKILSSNQGERPFKPPHFVMLKRSREQLEKCDRDYPGVLEYAERLEAEEFPKCPRCDSENTAKVNVGVIGRTILLCTMTTKFHLIPNGPKEGAFFCNSCRTYFDALG